MIRSEIEKEVKEQTITQCDCCGGPVVVKGNHTKYCIPVDAKILKEMGFKLNEKEKNKEI